MEIVIIYGVCSFLLALGIVWWKEIRKLWKQNKEYQDIAAEFMKREIFNVASGDGTGTYQARSFFDMSQKEKEDIVHKATQISNEEQLKTYQANTGNTIGVTMNSNEKVEKKK